MAQAAPRPCRQPGCSSYQVDGGYCEQHQRTDYAHYDDRRGTAAQRGYDARWRRVRNRKLNRNPMCEHCERKPATDVDHIVPIRNGGARLRMSNLQSLCRPCHATKTAREQRA